MPFNSAITTLQTIEDNKVVAYENTGAPKWVSDVATDYSTLISNFIPTDEITDWGKIDKTTVSNQSDLQRLKLKGQLQGACYRDLRSLFIKHVGLTTPRTLMDIYRSAYFGARFVKTGLGTIAERIENI